MIDTHHDFWHGAILILDNHNALENAHHVPFLVKLSPIIVALVGIILAWFMYIKYLDIPKILSKRLNLLYRFSFNKFWFDEIYEFLLCVPIKKFGQLLWKKGDVGFIDRFGPDGVAYLFKQLATKIKSLQTGYVYHYAFAMFIGLILLFSWQLLLLTRN